MKDDVPQRLLYDPGYEHDACGVGFVADTSGRASRVVVETALEVLGNLAHRGAVDADGKTGDGAGLLVQLPGKLLLREIEKRGCAHPPREDIAAGMFFLPRGDEVTQARCRQIVERVLRRCGLFLFGWRRAPVNENALGRKACQTAPLIEQALIARGNVEGSEFERALYLARKEIESRAPEIEGFYAASLSSRAIVYKGLMAAAQLREFYLDLTDEDFQSALAVFHQRYSTNTFPNWALARPYTASAAGSGNHQRLRRAMRQRESLFGDSRA
jgi:glutamate synthase (ferredoxin)